MKTTILFAFTCACALITFTDAFKPCSSNSYIRRVYVYRRPLGPLKFFVKMCQLAHSGLIMKLADGKECVLEYMGDGKAHLYQANYKTKGWKWWAKMRGAWPLSFTDYKNNLYPWQVTRQYHGSAVGGTITPQQAYRKMQSLMGYNYDLIKNNCHMGQERTRRYLGLDVSDAYKNPFKSPAKLCQCVRAVPGMGAFLKSSYLGLNC